MKKSNFFVQFIRLAGGFWCFENKETVRRLSLMLLILTIAQIAVAVVITQWSADLFNALDQHSMSKFFTQVSLIVLIFAANIIVTVSHIKVKRDLQIGWRAWLTNHLIDRWMYQGRHYLVTHTEKGEHDNPDGRIAEDIRIATESAIDMCHSLLYSVLLLFSFSQILWSLSGVVILDLAVVKIPIHGHLVWLALLYASAASLLGWWMGQPLTKATDAKQTAEANFRFSLITAQENSLSIAMIHGENNERQRFRALFSDITGAWQQQTKAWERILFFSSGYSVLSMAFPILVSAPRYILGTLSLGALMQSAQSFQQMASALSWPVDNMTKVFEWRASVERVLGLIEALDYLEEEIDRPDPSRIRLEKTDRSVLSFDKLCIAKLNGEEIISCIQDKIKAGEHVLITGNFFTGSKLFKAITGLWPWGHGQIGLPPDNETMFFMPPRPYLPTGTLRAAICYPATNGTFSAELEATLTLVGLDELLTQLNQVDTWSTVLSREMQQRIGLVRLLLYKPQWIFIQEAFDSLDSESEVAAFRLICQQLPDATMLTVTNMLNVAAFHPHQLPLT
ncbi:MAG: ABC transporter ATP-binding protein/permease [Methylococcales bacterium]|nr:ABC transporter ATP-binding protein/permease [Methylococcales bacterium]